MVVMQTMRHERIKRRFIALLVDEFTSEGVGWHPLGVLLLPSVDDALEVSALQRSATDQATVDVRLREEFRSVACLAATAVEDRCLLSSLCALLLSYCRADVSEHLLSLVRCSGLACTDSPDRLVSDDDVLPSLCVEVEY